MTRSSGSMKAYGAYLVNTARGKIVDEARSSALSGCGRIAGYAGDVWFPQCRRHATIRGARCLTTGMTPHISGSSLSAQARYAARTSEILECWFDGRPIRDEYLIVAGGHLAGSRSSLVQHQPELNRRRHTHQTA